MTDDTCPVCGKGEFKMLDGFDGPLENPTQPVSHLDCVREMNRKFREERRLRQAADSALAQALRHPNSKLDHVAGYLYRLEHQPTVEQAEAERDELRSNLRDSEESVGIWVEVSAEVCAEFGAGMTLARVPEAVRELKADRDELEKMLRLVAMEERATNVGFVYAYPTDDDWLADLRRRVRSA